MIVWADADEEPTSSEAPLQAGWCPQTWQTC